MQHGRNTFCARISTAAPISDGVRLAGSRETVAVHAGLAAAASEEPGATVSYLAGGVAYAG